MEEAARTNGEDKKGRPYLVRLGKPRPEARERKPIVARKGKDRPAVGLEGRETTEKLRDHEDGAQDHRGRGAHGVVENAENSGAAVSRDERVVVVNVERERNQQHPTKGNRAA